MASSHAPLSARPRTDAPIGPPLAGDVSSIDVGTRRAAQARLPAATAADAPAPLVLLLHGSGGDPAQALGLLGARADAAGLVLVAPASDDYTWDVIASQQFGPDVDAIDRALAWVFERRAIDPRRLAIAGFSDGASYALSIALANGALFSHAIALSPGFVAGEPDESSTRKVFVAHGRGDRVLPVDCSRRIVPALRGAGIAVDYREYDGGHEIPDAIADAAVRWLVGS
jgi:phospholipase/carboxylesterase